MATWSGDNESEFKETILEQLEYRRSEYNLTWPQLFRLVLEVLAYLMENHE